MTNFAVIVADDLTLSLMPFMPFTRDMNRQGRVFSGCRIDCSICQPSRMGLFSGLGAKDHEVYFNTAGDLATIDQDDFVVKWLSDAGYRTGLIGKYTNGEDGTEAVHTGWTTWKKFESEGVAPAVGTSVWNGSTSTPTTVHQIAYLSNQFTSFTSGSEPWCVFLCPEMPHVPYSPRVPDMFKFTEDPYVVPNEVDVSDKPAWIQAFTQMTEPEKRILRSQFRSAAREAASTEILVKFVYNNMDPTDTVLFFISDNGFNFGEHNRRVSAADLFPKIDVYDTSLLVPFVVYGEGFTPGTTPQPTHTQDITATIAAMAGVTPPYTLDGVDLRDVQNNPASYDSRTLLHQVRGPVSPSHACPEADVVTTMTRKLIRYLTGPTYEAYDLDTDPNELVNWAADGGRIAERNALEAQLDALL